MMSDPRYAELFLGGEVGGLTTENCLKPEDTQPMPGVFIFGEAEALILIAERNGLAVHGHTLVYDKAMPQWMQDLPYKTAADKRRGQEIFEQHIWTVVRHFRGRIASWDVVNEAVAGFNSQTQLQDNLWFQMMGERYIDIAFHAAREADPDAKLFINDYGMETNPQGRGAFMLELTARLRGRRVPLHGVGIEGHVYELPRDSIDPQTLGQLMRDFGAQGLLTRVSELDVTGANGPRAQAQQYVNALRPALQAQNCIGLTTWGLDDLQGSTAGLVNGRLRPGDALPYTVDYRPKLARRAMRDVLRAA
jgi:endo-1,4-beta-xylanase